MYSKIKNEAIKFRVEGKKSLKEISKILRISKSTASLWLRNYKLPSNELHRRICLAAKKASKTKNKIKRERIEKEKAEGSKFFTAFKKNGLLKKREWIGKLSEAAVIFRLILNGFEIYSSIFDCDKIDFIIRKGREGKLIRLQAKTVRRVKRGWGKGEGFIPLICQKGHYGRRKIGEKDFDFIVGYDLFSDSCYVFNKNQIRKNKTTIGIKRGIKEGWHIIK